MNRIKIVYTCCDKCHKQHKTLFAARLHYIFLEYIRKELFIGIVIGFVVGVIIF